VPNKQTTQGGNMKKLILAIALSLTATTGAFANAPINVKKVNKVIASVIQPELTADIQALEIKFDERSNLENVKKLKTAVLASATAKSSVWSANPTTLDVKAGLKTLTSDKNNTKMEAVASVGSKTDAVALYRYVAAFLAKESQEPGQEQSPTDLEFLAWFNTAAQTQALDAIPEQLKQLIVIVKKAIAEDPAQTPSDIAIEKLLNSLKVETNNQEVVLRTSEAVNVDDITISNVSFKISETGMSLTGKVAFTVGTEQVSALLNTVKDFLTMVEKADAETLQTLRESAQGYIQFAEDFVKGND
jgi:hypothetical protein